MSGDFAGHPEAKRSKFRRFTREAICRRSEDGSTPATEKIREDLWVLASKLASLADLAAVKTPIDVEPETIISTLDTLRVELQEFLPRVSATMVCACGDAGECKCEDEEKEARADQRTALLCLVHAAERNVTLCDERAREVKRVAGIYGCNFHPGTTCSVCDASPIVGWMYKCVTCDVCICEERRCIASHPLDHEVTLHRSPPPAAPGSDLLVAAEQQQWRVNCIMGHWPIPRARGDKTPRKFLYHVSWEGKGVQPTWEHEDSLCNTELLAAYQRQHQKKRRLQISRSRS
jgi:hypothetical protein